MSLKAPLVSVIMNCFNGEAYLREAIESVYSQTYPHWEIIFWDNLSTDGSAEIAKSYDERLKYYCALKNSPLGEARNHALSKASGDFVAILDVDDLWTPDKLQAQVDYMGKFPETILCYTNSCVFYEGTVPRNLVPNSNPLHSGAVFPHLIHFQKPFVNLQSVLIHRSLAGSELYFNDAYTFVEDYDLFYRLSLMGDFGCVDQFMVHYRVHSSNLSTAFNVEKYKKRLQECEDVMLRFKEQIELYHVDSFPIYAYMYSIFVFEMLKHGERAEAERYVPQIKKYHSPVNILLYVLLKTRMYFMLRMVTYERVDKVRQFLKRIFSRR